MSIEKLLTKSKELREKANSGATDSDNEPQIEYEIHAILTDEVKDKIIAELHNTLMDVICLMSGSTAVAPLTDAIVLERARKVIDKCDELAREGLDE